PRRPAGAAARAGPLLRPPRLLLQRLLLRQADGPAVGRPRPGRRRGRPPDAALRGGRRAGARDGTLPRRPAAQARARAGLRRAARRLRPAPVRPRILARRRPRRPPRPVDLAVDRHPAGRGRHRSRMALGDRRVLTHLRRDPKLAAIIERVGPCKLVLRDEGTHFASLVRSIVYQQLSGKAAATILERVRGLFGGRDPTPEELLAVGAERLRAAGLSRQKI